MGPWFIGKFRCRGYQGVGVMGKKGGGRPGDNNKKPAPAGSGETVLS